MTLAELHEIIGWQLDGRLQFLASDGAWADWEIQCPPSSLQIAAHFRRRPDPPPMPDEVFVSRSDNGRGLHFTLLPRFPDEVRYIRADAVIDGRRLEFRYKGEGGEGWETPDRCEYRFKP